MSLAIYIHWPFCKSKCPYCDFNSHVAQQIDHERWAKAYLTSLKYWHHKTRDRHIHSVFFGGGTPSLMAPSTTAAVIQFIRDHWGLTPECEITLEANPTSFEQQKFEDFRRGGVNRLSLGVQSLRTRDLEFLGREHSVPQAIAAIRSAATIFDRISFDLIYARPNQSLNEWQEELEEALEICNTPAHKNAAQHFSLYQLTIEQGTPFYTRHQRAEFQIPEQDLAADLYDLTQDIMNARGLPAYEISNHAAGGQESRHNLTYWRYQDYLGIGPGAHGRITLRPSDPLQPPQKYATRDHRAPEIWLKKIDDSEVGLQEFTAIDPQTQFDEFLMMGLRLREGISADELNQKTQGEPQKYLNMAAINHLRTEGMIDSDPNFLRTTRRGARCLNAVTGYILR